MLFWEQESSSGSSSKWSSISGRGRKRVDKPSKRASSAEDQHEHFIGGFFLQLFKWKGSVYQAIWKTIAIWLCLYCLISLLDVFILSTGERHKTFEALCVYCDAWISSLPIGILLALLLLLVCVRWWKMWDLLPWPDTVALYVTTTMLGEEERTRLMRLTVVRYMNFACIQAMALFVPSFQRRFLKWGDFVDAGLLNENERAILKEISNSEDVQNFYHVPLVWAATIVTKARKENRISSDEAAHKLLDQIAEFRRRCGTSLHVGMVQIPLMFMQVVTLVVYAYFAGALLGRQFIAQGRHTLDIWVPLFTLAEIVFYWGWLKTAEALLCPHGSGGDLAFDMDWIVDRHVKVGNMIVDDMHGHYPEMVRDYEKLYNNNKAGDIFITVTGEDDTQHAGIQNQAADITPSSRRRKNNSIVDFLTNGIAAGQPALTSGLTKAKNKLSASISFLLDGASREEQNKEQDRQHKGMAGNDEQANATGPKSTQEERGKCLSEPTRRRARLGSFSSVPDQRMMMKLVIPCRGKRVRGSKLTVMPSVDEHGEQRIPDLKVETPDEVKRPGTLPMTRKPRHWAIRNISSTGSDVDDDSSDDSDDIMTPTSSEGSHAVPMSAMPMESKASPFSFGASQTMSEWNQHQHPKPANRTLFKGSKDDSGFSLQDERHDFTKPYRSAPGTGNVHRGPAKMDSLKVPETPRAAFFRLGSSLSPTAFDCSYFSSSAEFRHQGLLPESPGCV